MIYSGQTFQLSGKDVQWKQVNSTNAKKAFDAGKTVMLHPCRMLVKNPWQNPIPTDKRGGNSFDWVVGNFTHYNCNPQLGKYPIFFVEL